MMTLEEVKEFNAKLDQCIKECEEYIDYVKNGPKKVKFDIFLPFDRLSF